MRNPEKSRIEIQKKSRTDAADGDPKANPTACETATALPLPPLLIRFMRLGQECEKHLTKPTASRPSRSSGAASLRPLIRVPDHLAATDRISDLGERLRVPRRRVF